MPAATLSLLAGILGEYNGGVSRSKPHFRAEHRSAQLLPPPRVALV
jgi:hypothetical protein